MPEYATGGIVERGEVGEHGDLIPAILCRDCCTHLWPAADSERGLLDRINRRLNEES